ncbi:MAG: signal peptidase I [Cellulophaga sp.]
MISLILFFLAIQLIHFLGTWKLYIKANRKAWEALIPIYNGIILLKIINRPWWWIFLLFFPIINLLLFPIIWVETIRSFGRNNTKDTCLVLFTLGFFITYLNYNSDKLQYIENRNLQPKSALGEWVSSILFAVIAATFIHTYFMQPFVIPTSSLEKTLLVGDFLFVSKFHYGARLPMTAIAAPMVHDTLPLLKTRSYTNWPQLPYLRLPGIQKIKKNDIIVYNWPADTVEKFFTRPNRKILKPVDKKSNYVKRCVGTPGDSLEIKDGYLFINGNRLQLSANAQPQYSYTIETKRSLTPRYMYKNYDVTSSFGRVATNKYVFRSLTETAAAHIEKDANTIKVTKILAPKGQAQTDTFPHSSNYKWNQDNFGPIYIPKKGTTIELNKTNLPLYKRIIEVYEHNELNIEDGKIQVNGKSVSTYTFKQNYYWGMGDNRSNSEDCRNWGYIPENHIIGKAVFIWFSWDSHAKGINKIRWSRLFSLVTSEKQQKSYFIHFIVFLVLYFSFLKLKVLRKK